MFTLTSSNSWVCIVFWVCSAGRARAGRLRATREKFRDPVIRPGAAGSAGSRLPQGESIAKLKFPPSVPISGGFRLPFAVLRSQKGLVNWCSGYDTHGSFGSGIVNRGLPPFGEVSGVWVPWNISGTRQVCGQPLPECVVAVSICLALCGTRYSTPIILRPNHDAASQQHSISPKSCITLPLKTCLTLPV